MPQQIFNAGALRVLHDPDKFLAPVLLAAKAVGGYEPAQRHKDVFSEEDILLMAQQTIVYMSLVELLQGNDVHKNLKQLGSVISMHMTPEERLANTDNPVTSDLPWDDWLALLAGELIID